MDKRIVNLLEKFVNDSEINIKNLPYDQSIIELGIIDSLGLSDFLAELEKIKGTPLDYSKLDFDSFTINGIKNLLI